MTWNPDNSTDSTEHKKSIYLKLVSKQYGIASLKAKLSYWCDRNPEKVANSLIGDCDYYQWRYNNFKNRHNGCEHKNPPDYYLDYGFKYCERFREETHPKLSELGQKWLDNALYLLQVHMEKGLIEGNFKSKYNSEFNTLIHFVGYKDIELNNSFFEQFAFATHTDAYMDAGLSALSFEDLVEILGTPDINEWLRGETLKQFWIVFTKMVYKWPIDRTAQVIKEEKKKLREKRDNFIKEFSTTLYEMMMNTLKQKVKQEIQKIVPTPEIKI